MTREEEDHFYQTNNFGGGSNWFEVGKNVVLLSKEEIAMQRGGRPSWSSSNQTINDGLTPINSFEQDVMQIAPADQLVNPSQTDN